MSLYYYQDVTERGLVWRETILNLKDQGLSHCGSVQLQGWPLVYSVTFLHRERTASDNAVIQCENEQHFVIVLESLALKIKRGQTS